MGLNEGTEKSALLVLTNTLRSYRVAQKQFLRQQGQAQRERKAGVGTRSGSWKMKDSIPKGKSEWQLTIYSLAVKMYSKVFL